MNESETYLDAVEGKEPASKTESTSNTSVTVHTRGNPKVDVDLYTNQGDFNSSWVTLFVSESEITYFTQTPVQLVGLVEKLIAKLSLELEELERNADNMRTRSQLRKAY